MIPRNNAPVDPAFWVLWYVIMLFYVMLWLSVLWLLLLLILFVVVFVVVGCCCCCFCCFCRRLRHAPPSPRGTDAPMARGSLLVQTLGGASALTAPCRAIEAMRHTSIVYRLFRYSRCSLLSLYLSTQLRMDPAWHPGPTQF